MQINQIASMIEWLDEERRHDKAIIATLEERVAQQVETIDQMLRRVKSVESDQSVIKQETLPAKKSMTSLISCVSKWRRCWKMRKRAV